jgi:hypothetical protein
MEIWTSLWSSDQYSVLKQRLELNHRKSNLDINDILQTLVKISLRCDVLNYLRMRLE